MSEEHAIQGLATKEQPYACTIDAGIDNQFITFRGALVAKARLDRHIIKCIVEELNIAYQQGFHDCSVQLMNEGS